MSVIIESRVGLSLDRKADRCRSAQIGKELLKAAMKTVFWSISSILAPTFDNFSVKVLNAEINSFIDL